MKMKKNPISKSTNVLSPRLESELANSPQVLPLELQTRIKHSVNLGDLIACMAAIKKYYDVTKRQVIISQSIGTLAAYYQGASHPTKNEAGEHVCMNAKMWDMVKPLIESQYYVHSFEKYEGQKIDLDFDVIRGKTFVNLPNGMIQSWIVFAFPDLACDLSKPWITIEGKAPKHITKQVGGKILINFTERYRNSIMDYFFLKNYTDDLIFSGTEREHFLFCNQWQLNIPRIETNDFLDLAYAVRDARFTIGNQSFLWNLCEALKSPRILEMCSFAPNCAPMIGEDSYGYYHQVGAEYYFRKLYNQTANK